jgi:tetratricopeptide (TPR) repeat protein
MENIYRYYRSIFLLLIALFILVLPMCSSADENAVSQKPLPTLNTDKLRDDLQRLDKAIADNPHDAEAYLKRGKIYISLGDQQKAIADFTRVIELKPAYAEAYLQRGIAHSESGKYENALRDLNKALDLNPRLEDAYIQRGHIYGILGNNEDAEIDYQRASELNPQKAPVKPEAETVKKDSIPSSKSQPKPKSKIKPKKIIVIGNRDTKNYHLPGMKYYGRVKKHHRVIFYSEQTAIKAGYHKAPQ